MDFSSSAVWVALAYIIFTNILLSGDNAVVIAMASRNLPKEHQKKAIFWGSAAAILMRIVLTLVAVQLLTVPYLKIIGAILLVYIGVHLMADSDDDEEMNAPPSIFSAIRTILIADLVMSLDNVVAVAAAADPVIITLGAALLGYLAGEMFATDPAIHETLIHALGPENADIPFQVTGILLVVVIGLWLKKKSSK